MNSGQPSTWSRRSKIPSTCGWLLNSVRKNWLSCRARRIWSALLIITVQATREKTKRQKMITFASGVALRRTYISSISLELPTAAAMSTGTVIPSRLNHVLLGREEFYCAQAFPGQRQPEFLANVPAIATGFLRIFGIASIAPRPQLSPRPLLSIDCGLHDLPAPAKPGRPKLSPLPGTGEGQGEGDPSICHCLWVHGAGDQFRRDTTVPLCLTGPRRRRTCLPSA